MTAIDKMPYSRQDGFGWYLQQIGKIKLLKPEEEIKLGKRIQAAQKLIRFAIDNNIDQADHQAWAEFAEVSAQELRHTLKAGERATQKMVAANLRLVVSVAKRYTKHGINLEDLVQEGAIGLQRGAEKFDPTKGYKFSTYATWWIRQAMTRAIDNDSRTIRLPVHINETRSRISTAIRRLKAQDEPVTLEAIAASLGVTVDKVEFVLEVSRPTSSLDVRVGPEGDIALGDLIPDDSFTPDDFLADEEIVETTEFLLSMVTERERFVLEVRHLSDSTKKPSLEEVGRQMGVTRERVRQIEQGAKRKLKAQSAYLQDII